MGCNCSTSMFQHEKSLDDIRRFYKIGKLLGSGSFGQVRECQERTTGLGFAVKIMERKMKEKLGGATGGGGRPSNEQMIRAEVDILSQSAHDNIVRFCNFFQDKHFLYVVLEKCDGGELFYQIVNRRQFTEADAAILCRQMLSALEYLHSRGVVHRDIKAENFLFKSKAADSSIKLIDFGMSARIVDGGYLSDLCGSPHYISPELIRKNYNTLADLWAFGVMLYLMLFGRYPFEGTKPADIAREIVSKNLDWNGTNASHLTDESKDFLRKLLERDPKKRMSAAAALKHPWIEIDSESKRSSIIPRDFIEDARRLSIENNYSNLDSSREIRRNSKLAEVEKDFLMGRSTGRRLSESKQLPSAIISSQEEGEEEKEIENCGDKTNASRSNCPLINCENNHQNKQQLQRQLPSKVAAG
eukprot:GHVS01034330.1.p1 GENE.GHVS01034330.1~~GHVS01034330.1.p1  ORF type:complete len:415 (+),score=49.87 GHVS01034330.1:80-1324(+)